MKKTILNFICVFLSFLLIALYSVKISSYPVKIPTEMISAIKKDNIRNTNFIRIMTYNLLSDGLGFDGIAAQYRSESVIKIINSLDIDVLSLQEVSKSWFLELNDKLNLSCTTPIKTSLNGNMTTILYNKNRLVLINKGEKAYSDLSDSRLRRFVWALFKDRKTNNIFIVINTHLNLTKDDNSVPLSQAKELIDFTSKLKMKYDYPIFITGDFNSDKDFDTQEASLVYDLLTTRFSDCKKNSLQEKHGNRKSINSPSVDHIFTYENEHIHTICLLSYEGMEKLSDHYPLYVDFIIKNSHNKS